MAGSFTALPHPGPCILRKHRGQPLRSPTPGGLGVGEKAAGVGAQSPAGCRMPLAEGGGLWHAPLPSSHGEGGHTQGLQAQVSGVKANCISSCQPQEERHKHHLSAGADSVGDCSGLPQRFKMEMA